MTANMALVRSMLRRAQPPKKLDVGTLAPTQTVPHGARRLIQLFQPIQPSPWTRDQSLLPTDQLCLHVVRLLGP